MVESLDQGERTPAVSDDLIKDSLKIGLSSIHASDDLVRDTLALCHKEIEAKSRQGMKKAIWPWMLKIGTPLAAGALVCVLMLNGPQMKSTSENAAAPSESVMGGALMAQDKASISRDSGEIKESASAEPVPSTPPSITSTNGEEKGVGESTFAYGIEGLFSAANRTEEEYRPDTMELMEHFEAIVTQYNTVQGTQFTLYKSGVTRIQTLVETGVTAQMLQDMTDYHQLLSGKGYWLLPLHSSNGLVEGLVTVNTMDSQSKELNISSNDFVFSTNNHRFLVSPHPSGALIAKNCELMFDSASLTQKAKSEGYKNISDITIVDINYGMDFLVMLTGDDKQLSIPFVVDQNLYGVENNRLYQSDELIKIIIDQMLK